MELRSAVQRITDDRTVAAAAELLNMSLRREDRTMGSHVAQHYRLRTCEVPNDISITLIADILGLRKSGSRTIVELREMIDRIALDIDDRLYISRYIDNICIGGKCKDKNIVLGIKGSVFRNDFILTALQVIECYIAIGIRDRIGILCTINHLAANICEINRNRRNHSVRVRSKLVTGTAHVACAVDLDITSQVMEITIA